MGDKTGIQWTDATWNPVVGCSVVSPGCTNCYAMTMAARIVKMQGSALDATSAREDSPYLGTVKQSKAGAVWTGVVRKASDNTLTLPLSWRRPRRIFVNSMGDLFHESVPYKWIDRVFAVAALSPRHTFQILTKRSKRMREYCGNLTTLNGFEAFLASNDFDDRLHDIDFPFPNVHLGVSAEDQTRADERIPDLLATPAAVRFVSAEPLLGAIDFNDIPWPATRPRFPETDDISDGRSALRTVEGVRLDWIIVGGESGKGARPMHPAWARSIRDQCKAASVPFFFKQWGEWEEKPIHVGYGLRDNETCLHADGSHNADGFGGDAIMRRVGKKAAGRLLDGREYNEMPL